MNYPPYRGPTPWGAGIAVALMVATLTAVAVFAFGRALTEVHWLLALAVNVIAAAGVAPTAFRWRLVPVTRWVVAGGTAGVLIAWVALVLALVVG